MDDMRILVWMGACALVAVLVLVLVVSHWFSLWMSRKDEQESCPYCHGRKMLTCDGGKVRLIPGQIWHLEGVK